MLPSRRVAAITAEAVEAAILSAVAARPHGSVCPSEVARALWPDDWRARMDKVRAASARLQAAGRLRVTQRGREVEVASARGPVRLSLPPG